MKPVTVIADDRYKVQELQRKLDRLEIYANLAANIIELDANTLRRSHEINGEWDDEAIMQEYGDMMGCVIGIRELLKT